MQEPSFTQYGTRKRGLQRPPILEPGTGADEHIRSGPGAMQGLVSQAASAAFQRHFIWDHHEQVVVAVGAGISTRDGSEKIDPLRLVRSDKI
jgi:hypothetical protein